MCFFVFYFLLALVNIFSISDYEWMVGSGDIDNLCQLPLGGRYIIEPILILIPCTLLLFFRKKQKSEVGLYINSNYIYRMVFFSTIYFMLKKHF
ncbi:YjeO family protein [Proteus mirabilis]